MKIALVHDYLNEFGGAERVLEALCEIWPEAPIYTAFYRKDSSSYKRFKGKKIIASWAQNVPFFATFLHSPLRFLASLIWNSFDFSNFDVVIGSASWYVTKGFKKGNWDTGMLGYWGKKRKPNIQISKLPSYPIEICYCHTPPRYLYGYPTSVDWQKYWLVKVYAVVVNHFMRVYDYEAAQRVDFFIANSKEVAGRIKKFYRRESVVIYPPVDVRKFVGPVSRFLPASARLKRVSKRNQENNVNLRAVGSPSTTATRKYFLVVSRLVASKKVDIAVEVCAKLGLYLKVVGVGKEMSALEELARKSLMVHGSLGKTINDQRLTINFLGEVSDEELIKLYQGARAVVFPAQQEDFGLVPVEAMAAGVPVIVNAEGGVLETVIDPSTRSARSGQVLEASKGKCTGVYFDPPTAGSLTLAINNFIDLEKKGYFDSAFIQNHAQKFEKERFKKEILAFVKSKVK